LAAGGNIVFRSSALDTALVLLNGTPPSIATYSGWDANKISQTTLMLGIHYPSTCGRYELHTHPAAMALAFGIPIPAAIEAHYNIAPSQVQPVVRLAKDGTRELAAMRWA